MDRLLTDEELEQSIGKDYPDFRIADEGDQMADILHFTREAQDAKSIRVGQQAQGEWLNGWCKKANHGRVIHKDCDRNLKRYQCGECRQEMYRALYNGTKAPWEAS